VISSVDAHLDALLIECRLGLRPVREGRRSRSSREAPRFCRAGHAEAFCPTNASVGISSFRVHTGSGHKE